MGIETWTKSVVQYKTWASVDTIRGLCYVDCSDLKTFTVDDLRDLADNDCIMTMDEHDAHAATIGLYTDFGISGIYHVEVCDEPAFFGYLSMPGYLDCTELVGPYQTIEAANAALDDLIAQDALNGADDE